MDLYFLIEYYICIILLSALKYVISFLYDDTIHVDLEILLLSMCLFHHLIKLVVERPQRSNEILFPLDLRFLHVYHYTDFGMSFDNDMFFSVFFTSVLECFLVSCSSIFLLHVQCTIMSPLCFVPHTCILLNSVILSDKFVSIHAFARNENST